MDPVYSDTDPNRSESNRIRFSKTVEPESNEIFRYFLTTVHFKVDMRISRDFGKDSNLSGSGSVST